MIESTPPVPDVLPVLEESPKPAAAKPMSASRWMEMFQVIFLTLVIVVPIRLFVANPFKVDGSSMEPTFLNKEYLIVDELSYHFHAPQRGEVVVFHPPTDPSKYFIKRVIGLPGETVEIVNGVVKIYNKAHQNGWVLNESSYLDMSDYTVGEKVAITMRPVTMGPNEYFVMGDNRRASYDSRYFGPVNQSAFIGRAWLRGLPINRAGILTHIPDYSEPIK